MIAGLYLGFKDPWNQTDAQLKQSQKLLMSKKHLVRLIWSSETNLLGRPSARATSGSPTRGRTTGCR